MATPLVSEGKTDLNWGPVSIRRRPRFDETVYGLVLFFFFQAEDGIRDYKVTGVQTCALPICDRRRRLLRRGPARADLRALSGRRRCVRPRLDRPPGRMARCRRGGSGTGAVRGDRESGG